MTDKELIQQLLRRNHQLTAKCEGLTKRLQKLEGDGPIDKHDLAIVAYKRYFQTAFDRLALHDACLHVICENVEPPLDLQQVKEVAQRILNEIQLENSFEEPSTFCEDGHS